MQVFESVKEGFLQDIFGVLLVHQQAVAEPVQAGGETVIQFSVTELVSIKGALYDGVYFPVASFSA